MRFLYNLDWSLLYAWNWDLFTIYHLEFYMCSYLVFFFKGSFCRLYHKKVINNIVWPVQIRIFWNISNFVTWCVQRIELFFFTENFFYFWFHNLKNSKAAVGCWISSNFPLILKSLKEDPKCISEILAL